MSLQDMLLRHELKRQFKKLNATADKIEALEGEISALSDAALAAKTEEFRRRFKTGEKLDDLLPEAFAVVREAGKRVLNMRHFRVQLIGGIVLHQGKIAEMQTGEGKTLVATLPAYLNALSGDAVHIVTVNDYLAKRDAEWMGKIYKFLGMSVGVILHDMPFEEKKAAYAADITYATNTEIGFDYLRDNMAVDLDKVMQRDHTFAIVDEVDSILIDEARTPLIISAPSDESNEMYVLADRFVKLLKKDDYFFDEKDKHAYLTEEGVEKAERFFRLENLSDIENTDVSTKINSALRANFLMFRDKDYIVENDEIIIVDEFTGRKMAGRRYSEGLHQAIEAKEKVEVRKENRTIATITYQNYFRLYKKLAGMTGTALTEAEEFLGIYKLDVLPIPTNMPMVRNDEPDKVYLTKDVKYKFVIEDIKESNAKGQPVLVGTTNVETSEYLSVLLKKAGIPHNVLNAKHHLEEAAIIAQAGCVGAVTIATNMAGRGTDILLGGNPEYIAKQEMLAEKFTEEQTSAATAFNTLTDPEEIRARERFNELFAVHKIETDKQKELVKQAGGLRVIGTERHEARRIDNQLRGRSGRQGDFGSSCFYLSFEDDLLRLFGGDRMKAIVTMIAKDEDTCIQHPMLAKQIENAQKSCEENNYQRRKRVLNFDDVMNKQRALIYSQRNEVLHGKDIHEQILCYMEDLSDSIVNEYINSGEDGGVDFEEFNKKLELELLRKGTAFITPEFVSTRSTADIEQAVYDQVVQQYEEKIAFAEVNNINFRATERNVLLNQVDRLWMEHLDNMEILKKGIGLRGLGQKDPVMEYRREGTDMFDQMIDRIQHNTTIILAKLDVEAIVERRNAFVAMQQRKIVVRNTDPYKNIGRNDPCPCGSGLKYKNCCGKNKV